MSVAALVLGIISLVIACFGFFAGPLSIGALIMGIIGIVLASVSMKNENKGTAGLVLSIISTVFSLVPAIIWILAIIIASSTQPAMF